MPGMEHQPLLHRLVIGFIRLNAGFVAVYALTNPRAFDKTFTWANLPPLHARFVGSLYLCGTVLLAGALFARRARAWWPATVATTIFTASMGVLTALNPEAFDWSTVAVKVWVIAYITFPLAAGALAIAYARPGNAVDTSGAEAFPPRVVHALQCLAGFLAVVGIGLLVARERMAEWWPWKVDIGVAQFYGGPFVTLAWCAWAYSRRARRDATGYLTAMACLGVATLVISLVHRRLFDTGNLSTYVWFGAALVIATGFLLLLIRPRALAAAPAPSPATA